VIRGYYEMKVLVSKHEIMCLSPFMKLH